LLKQRLLDAPEDAAAHFNLGRCYLNAPQPCLGVASGEFEVALTLFLQQGRKSPIKEFGDEYFELRCYLEIAKTYLRSYQIAQTLRADPAVLNRILDQCRRIAEAARRVTPDAPEIQQLDDILDALPRAV
jgi:hypothetical protein